MFAFFIEAGSFAVAAVSKAFHIGLYAESPVPAKTGTGLKFQRTIS